MCNPARLSELFEASGLTNIDSGFIDLEMVFRDFDDYWSPFLGGQGPSGGYTMSLSEEKREKLREALRARLPQDADGQIRVISRAWTVRGLKPRM